MAKKSTKSVQKPAANNPGQALAKTSEPSDGPSPDIPQWWATVLLVVILGVVAGIRIRLLDFPLERDEGEYAYIGQLMLQGVPPYEQAYTMKWPGTPTAYAFIMTIFGQTPAGIHAGLLLVNVATALMVYVLTRRLAGDAAGVVAAGTYALLSIG